MKLLLTLIGLIVCGLINPSISLAYTTGMSASVVIGQTNFTSTSSLSPPTSTSLDFSNGIIVVNGKLIISDNSKNRVLIYNQIPTTSGTAADVVIGQSDFVSSGGTASATRMYGPKGLSSDGSRLFLSDYSNGRVLIYNTIPTTNGASADLVIGAPNLSSGSCDTTAVEFCGVSDVYFDPPSGRLVIADRDNNRVLIYNSVPTSDGAPADVVVGNSNMTGSTTGVTTTLNHPEAVRVIDGKLVVADTDNDRVLIWNSVPTSNGATADVVIGQTSLSGTSANQGGTLGANTLYAPTGLGWDGYRLYVADYNNVRILVYNGLPTSNNASANLVIGQPNFTSDSPTPATAYTMAGSSGPIAIYNNKLIVGDSGHRRVLIFENVVNTPSITINSIGNGLNGKSRINGHVTVGGSSYSVSAMQASVNGGGYTTVTPLDGSFNSTEEDWYLDFDKGSFLNDFGSGNYSIKFEGVNSNYDFQLYKLFFTPFTALTPSKLYEWRTDKLGDYPTFNFSVFNNEKSRTILNANLSKYQIYIRKTGSRDWSLYLDNIPIDPSPFTTADIPSVQKQDFKAYYYNNRSQISVVAVKPPVGSDKLIEKGGKLLSTGKYEWKATAIDKSGNSLDSGSEVFKIKRPGLLDKLLGLVSNISFIKSNVYFPITVLNITNIGNPGITTNNVLTIKDTYTTNSTTPVFYGIAPVGSMVSVTLTDKNPKCTQNCNINFTSITRPDSKFGVNVKGLTKGRSYNIEISANKDDYYNILPEFELKVK